MSKQHISTAEAAARLAEALSAQDDLSHDQAEALLPALIDAEQAGEDVAGNAAFTAVLRHLDHCERCLNLYEQLADDRAAVVGEADLLPTIAPALPVFFPAPVRLGDHILLQVARGLIRRFTLTLDVPRLAPSLATLSGAQRQLYSDRLGQVPGTPLLAVTVGRDAGSIWLQVAVREIGQKTTWQLQLDLGDQTLSAATDSRGIARFTLPPDVALGEVRLHCEELPVEAENE